MTPTRRRTTGRHAPAGGFLLPALLASLLLAAPGAGQSAEEMIPDELAGLTLERVDVRGPAAARATFGAPDEDLQMNLVLAHGDLAGQLHGRIRSQMERGEPEIRELEIEGRSFTSFAMGSDLMVFRFSDDRFLAAGYDLSSPDFDRASLETSVVAALEDLGLEHVAEWTPPEPSQTEEDDGPGLETPPDRTESPPQETEEAPGRAETLPERAERVSERLCGEMDCLREAAAACDPARFSASLGPRVRADYRVTGAAADGGCRIEFRFAENPNPDLVDQPLSFVHDPDMELTREVVQEVLGGCLAGDERAVAAHGCEGPLVGAGGGR